MQIESLQNPKIKNIIKLQQKSRERKSQNVFVVEGIQENRLALEGNYIPTEIYICKEIYDDTLELPKVKYFYISKTIYEKIAYRKSTEGIIGIYKNKNISLANLNITDNNLFVILESVEKPGNLGAILRSCDGANVTAVIICDPQVDFFNPNVIRSSVGTVFTNQIAVAEKEEVQTWLKNKNTQIVSTFLRENTQSLFETDLTPSTALVMGTEATGLTDFWAEYSDILIKIPMKGKVDSLNISNASAICIYEALRQRSKQA